MMPFRHIPVMLKETIEHLNIRPGGIYVDCTLGGCGHSSMIAEKMAPDGILIGIDQDKDAVANAKIIFKDLGGNISIFHDNFINLKSILDSKNISGADGILLDLGISLHQIESSGRGFSFRADETLDMRMNTDSGLTAGDIINTYDKKDLIRIFKEYGEERWSKKIAYNIEKIRKDEKINSSIRLAGIICDSVPMKVRFQKIHPATRVFMALRIAVNKELEKLKIFMSNVWDLLNSGGRLCVLSFHSLEDRIVKKSIRQMEKPCTCPPSFPQCVCNKKPIVRSVFRKVMRPTDEEIKRNPMSRSTKLRIVEKL